MANLSITHQIIGKNKNFHKVTELPATRRTRPTRLNNRRICKVLAYSESSEPDLSVTINGLHMPNPFVIGSGSLGTNYTIMKRAFDEGWGVVIAKTVSYFVLKWCHIIRNSVVAKHDIDLDDDG